MLRRNDPLADRSSSDTKVQSLSSRIRANATIQRTSGSSYARFAGSAATGPNTPFRYNTARRSVVRRKPCPRASGASRIGSPATATERRRRFGRPVRHRPDTATDAWPAVAAADGLCRTQDALPHDARQLVATGHREHPDHPRVRRHSRCRGRRVPPSGRADLVRRSRC